MKIGTLYFEVVGKLIYYKSCEYFIASMDSILLTVCDQYDADYKRFGYEGGHLTFVVPLKVFWKSDAIFKKMRTELNRLFMNWLVDITITINEKGV
ncbi:hypothetical protein ES705_12811 [subsurface metagenome]